MTVTGLGNAFKVVNRVARCSELFSCCTVKENIQFLSHESVACSNYPAYFGEGTRLTVVGEGNIFWMK